MPNKAFINVHFNPRDHDDLRWLKVGHNGPDETTKTEQGDGLLIDMVTANGWYAGGRGGGLMIGEMSVQIIGEVGETLLSKRY